MQPFKFIYFNTWCLRLQRHKTHHTILIRPLFRFPMKWEHVLPLWPDFHIFCIGQKLKSFICGLHLSFKNFFNSWNICISVTNYLNNLIKSFLKLKVKACGCTSHHSRNDFRKVLSVSLLCTFHPDTCGNMMAIINSFLSLSIIKETNKALWC